MSEFPVNSSDQFDPRNNLPHQRMDNPLEPTDFETHSAEPARPPISAPEPTDHIMQDVHEQLGEEPAVTPEPTSRPTPNQVAPRLFLSFFKRFRL